MIKRITPDSVIKQTLSDYQDRAKEQVARKLAYAGETAITAQRQSYTYTQRTGNLLSSTAYVVMEKNEAPEPKSAGQQGEGQTAAKQVVQSLPSPKENTLSLVLVAGMHYAAYVSARGYDVLDTARQTATAAVQILLKK